MVRQKTRWLLVRIQLDDGHEKIDHGSVAEVTKKELARAIKDNIEQCFGIAATGPALDTQGSVVLCSRGKAVLRSSISLKSCCSPLLR
jgi:hypothetical protein